MRRFAIHIVIDFLFWLSCYLYASESEYKPFAENWLIFFGWFLGIVGLLSGFLKPTKRSIEFNVKRKKFHDNYCSISFVFEFFALGILGFFWTASIYFLGAIGAAFCKYKCLQERMNENIR